MFELSTNNADQLETVKSSEKLFELAELQLALVGGGCGAASLD